MVPNKGFLECEPTLISTPRLSTPADCHDRYSVCEQLCEGYGGLPQPESHLLNLPTELRFLIYEFLFNISCFLQSLNPNFVALLCTNSTIYKELMRVIYGTWPLRLELSKSGLATAHHVVFDWPRDAKCKCQKRLVYFSQECWFGRDPYIPICERRDPYISICERPRPKQHTPLLAHFRGTSIFLNIQQAEISVSADIISGWREEGFRQFLEEFSPRSVIIKLPKLNEVIDLDDYKKMVEKFVEYKNSYQLHFFIPKDWEGYTLEDGGRAKRLHQEIKSLEDARYKGRSWKFNK